MTMAMTPVGRMPRHAERKREAGRRIVEAPSRWG
jgi:hypothetical protein